MAIFNKIFCLLEMYLVQELLIFILYNTHRSDPQITAFGAGIGGNPLSLRYVRRCNLDP
jgi:hypothetical protein